MFGSVRGVRQLVSGVALLAVAFASAHRGVAAGPGHRIVPSDGGPEASVPVSGTSLSEATGAPAGWARVMVELVEPPAAVAYANALKASAGLPRTQARSAAVAAGRAQAAVVRSAHARFQGTLGRLSIPPRELYQVQKSLNGFALEVDESQLAELRALPGVKRVIPLYLEHPTNSTSVPFIGAPTVWANTIGLPAGADGTGIRIGIIDTGIDYLHPDFGGPGTALTVYQTESANSSVFTTAGSFPTAKVVGGTDFAGDAYTGSNAPTPDPNPMDCNGHGSHVAGTAAGLGMKTDGSTFTGPYDANPATYAGLLIGPGVAPKAQLYGLRVFGCTGSTGLTTQAIDWATDPNGDDDLSDHLDVINMSLGSSFGSVLTSTAIASDNAAAAGVVVVASAGNSGDTFFITGAPGTGSRVISTAAAVDSGEAAVSVTANAPAAVAGNYLAGSAAFGPALTPAGLTGNVVLALDPADAAGPSTTDGCSALTNAAAIAGNIALLDRGTCAFTIKVKNAQNAGAIAVIVADNAPGSPPPGLGGADATITIPSVRVTLATGNLFKANISGLNATLLGSPAGDTLAYFSSRGPRRIYGSPLRLKPDIAAPGLNITSVQTGHTCLSSTGCTGVADPSGFQLTFRNLTISGTSMASPHMAGVMALLKQLHPDWEVEELKALAMNYADHDVTVTPAGGLPRYGPSRVGGGRVDTALSALGSVVAMNAEDAGLVSVTFDPEVSGSVTQLKKVRLVNKGTTPQSYDLGIDLTNAPPGVSFSFPGGTSVTVAAGASVAFDVQMSANSTQMDEKRDPALDPTQGVQANYGDQPRSFLTEAEGFITFKQAGSLKFRLPVYMAEKPASQMSAPATIATGGAPTGSTTIPLSGVDLCTGTLAAGPTCTGTFPTDIESLVSPFELQVVSPADPVNLPGYADLQYAGVAYLQTGGSPSLANDLVLFGLSTWGDWSTPNEVAISVCVDFNNDGVYDRAVINSQPSIFVNGASQTDTFVRVVQNLSTNGYTILGLGSPVNLVGPNVVDTSLHLNNVFLMGATPSQLGFTSTAALAFRYKVVTCPASNPGCARSTTGDHCTPAPGTYYDIAAGPYSWNPAAQGLNFGGDFLDEDLNGASIPVTWNTANMTANASQGALLLHHHNKSGQRAEVVLLEGTTSADLSVTLGVSPASPALGGTTTLTVTAANAGPGAASGVSVALGGAAGTTWVSDTSGGAFNPSAGIWTIGSLASGANASIQIVFTVDSTDPMVATAMVSGASPLDPNPANNQSAVTISAPRSADLSLGMTVSSPTTLVGATVTYTLSVTNTGVDAAYSLNVQETFPAVPSLNPGSFTASQGVYSPATGVWNLASLGSGKTATLAITVTAPSMAGALTNQGTAASATSDPNTANNTASATTTVLSPAAVAGVTKTVAGSHFPGAVVTYTVVIPNSGTFAQQDNPGDEFTDILPATLQLLGATASSGTAVADTPTNTVHWNGSIAAGGSVTITITARIAWSAGGATVSNQGTAYFDADGNGTNESSVLTDDPSVGGATDPTAFQASAEAPIPAASTLGLALLGLLTALGAVLLLRSRVG
mgnify:CR=1 FL=1